MISCLGLTEVNLMDRIDWARPFGISLLFHLVVLIMAGFAVGKTAGHPPPDEYIPVEFILPSPQQEERSMPPLTVNMPQSGRTGVFSTQSSTSTVIPSEVVRQPGRPVHAGTVTVSGGDGDLPQSYSPKKDAGAAAPPLGKEEKRGDDARESTRTAGVSVDSVIGAFVSEVEKRKEYPYIARKRGQEGVVIVRVALSAGGELDDLTIVESSGFSQLDDAAMSAIRRVCPFYHGLGQGVRMMVPIDYRLL
jgi:protein TonB